MADEIPISGLPPTSSLGAADEIPIVQSGVTKKVAANLINDVLESDTEPTVYVNGVIGINSPDRGEIFTTYAGVEYAESKILDNTINKPYSIELQSDIDEKAMPLKPFLNINANGFKLDSTSISLDPSWNGVANAALRIDDANMSESGVLFNATAFDGQSRMIELYNCSFCSTSASATIAVVAKSAAEAYVYNNCLGNLPFGITASYTQTGGNLLWDAGRVPSLTLQSNSTSGPIVAQIGNAIFEDTGTVAVTTANSTAATVQIENCAVNGATFNFNGASGALSVRTNCLNPANVTNSNDVTITPTGNAQCIKVNFSPTGYTVATPPSGWSAALEQHLSGVSTKLNAYSYSGTDTTFGNGNILVQRSASGANVDIHIENQSNTASSNAFQSIGVAGASAGDPYTAYGITGGGQFAQGIDNSDSDAFKRTFAANLDSNVYERVTTAGEITHPLQPSFLAYLDANKTNKTGNGTAYQLGADALTEVFDQNSDFNTNGTFTAPVTGRYMFAIGVRVTNCTIATQLSLVVTTSNRTYQYIFSRAAGNPTITCNIPFLADMDAADTLTASVAVSGEAGDTNTINGSSTLLTYMSGYLAC